MDLRLDAAPRLISDSSVTVALHQTLPEKPNSPQKESPRTHKRKPNPKSALAPPPPTKRYHPPAKKNNFEPIAIKNSAKKKKKTIKPPDSKEVYERVAAKQDILFQQATRQPSLNNQAGNPLETANRIAAKRPAPPQTASSVIKAKPLYQYNPEPEYPGLAKRRGWEGVVLLRVKVTAEGGVASIDIHKSSGYTILDKSALRAVTSWRFIPASRDGNRTVSFVIIPVHYTLQG